jgi:hypothetical protein
VIVFPANGPGFSSAPTVISVNPLELHVEFNTTPLGALRCLHKAFKFEGVFSRYQLILGFIN